MLTLKLFYDLKNYNLLFTLILMPLSINIPQPNKKSGPSLVVNQPQKVQLKKKPPCIKLQVNKLVKPQSQKISTTKNNHSYNPSHNVSYQIFDHHQSVQKQVQTNAKKIKSMNFEQLYFQKIKQLRQQENFLNVNNQKLTIDSFFSQVQKRVPLSCKNSNSTKNQKKVYIKKEILSTKNYNSQGNKQNSQAENINASSKTLPKYTQNKFFKKSEPLKDNQNILNYSRIDEPNKQQQKNETQKVRRVLKLKKKNVRTKSNYSFNSSIEKQHNRLVQRNSLCSRQKPSLSTFDKRPNLSQQLGKLRLLTPSSQSSVIQNHQLSPTEVSIKQIVDEKIDHSIHEHVWGGVQCFFSFVEFKYILKELGFDQNQNQSVGFYVKKLWEHLGGDLYGGIVKKNMTQLLNIILEDDENDFNEITIDQNIQTPLPNDLIESSSLRLIKFNNQLKDQIRTFYFSLRMTKIASKIKDSSLNDYVPNNPKNSPNLSEKVQPLSVQSSIQLNSFQTKETPKQKANYNVNSLLLQNNPYLETISVKNRKPQMSPCLLPRPDETLDQDNVADFSPRMSKQIYEPFQSTILEKYNQKLPTELSSQNQMSFKSNRKALLSIDVNLGQGTLEKIVVYENQDPYEISLQLKKRYNIDEELRQKFQALLRNHLKNLLFKIQQVSQELFEDSVQLKDYENQTDFIAMESQSIF